VINLNQERRKNMKKIVLLAAVIVLVALNLYCFAGEKEEVQARLVAVLQEERAANAEFQLYQIKMKELQDRFPALQKEKKELSDQLKAMEEKEKAAKPAPAAPATTKK
jgi:predicted  nucleic acid-binding Zn-ribbon protein